MIDAQTPVTQFHLHMSRHGLILKLSCRDQPGIVAKIANYVAAIAAT